MNVFLQNLKDMPIQIISDNASSLPCGYAASAKCYLPALRRLRMKSKKLNRNSRVSRWGEEKQTERSLSPRSVMETLQIHCGDYQPPPESHSDCRVCVIAQATRDSTPRKPSRRFLVSDDLTSGT